MASILHVLSEDLPTGTLKQIDLLCRKLNTCGLKNWICSVEPNRHRRANLPAFEGRLLFCSNNWKLDPTFFPRFRRHLRQVDPALVQFWGDTSGNVGRLATALFGRIPIVSARRSFDSGSPHIPLVEQWLNARTSRIIVNNVQLKRALEGRESSPLINVVVNGVELWNPRNVVRSLHHELCLDSAVRFVGVMGDLRTKKRIKDLIWAMDLLRVIHPEMHLVIIGEGEELGRLMRFDRDVHRDRCVHFLGRRDDVREVLSQCFCFWQASCDEGCSNAVLEALSVGLPVVASDISGHKSIVVHGESGYLVPLRDCAEFARKTNLLLENEQRSRSMGEVGRRLVTEQYSVRKMIDGYRLIYQSIFDNRFQRKA